MEQHAIPREVISFSFKLIGFMTLKQFGYLALAAPVAYIIFMLFPIPYVNILLALLACVAGAAFAFFPVNDRPLEVFVRNLYRRLTSPSQYLYKKNNPPLKILSGLYFEADPHIILAHVDSKEKLSTYLALKNQAAKAAVEAANPRAGEIKALLQKPTPVVVQQSKILGVVPAPPSPSLSHPRSLTSIFAPALSSLSHLTTTAQPTAKPTPSPSTVNPQPSTLNIQPSTAPSPAHPYISGSVLNRKKIPLPGILIYIKDPATTKPLRILKTNPHGVFASFHPLPTGEFLIEVTDTAKNYQFEPVTITLDANPQKNIFTFMSREMM